MNIETTKKNGDHQQCQFHIQPAIQPDETGDLHLSLQFFKIFLNIYMCLFVVPIECLSLLSLLRAENQRTNHNARLFTGCVSSSELPAASSSSQVSVCHHYIM